MSSSRGSAAKKVCIVGAGPSGLVAAKTLLHDSPGAFNVTIIDQQPRIGGLWPLSSDDGAGLLHPLMLANQSKHTVQFSDLAWPSGTAEFPRAWQVGQYLDKYRARYCEDAELKLSCKLVKAEPLDGGLGWRTVMRLGDAFEREEESSFDYLIVASGFFGKPIMPTGLPENPSIPVVHSSKYRDLNALLKNKPGGMAGGKILIVGGQFSGVEIAGTIGNHLLSATNSPEESTIPSPEKYTIHHLVQRPSWVFPLLTSPKPMSQAAPFAPLDFASYNLANRPEPLVNTQGHITPEAARFTHAIFQNIVGGDQSDIHPDLAIPATVRDDPPFLCVSDTYTEHVRSGLITISPGKLASVDGQTASISPLPAAYGMPTAKDNFTTIGDVAAIILATGFDPTPSLSFLPPDILNTLGHDPSSARHPLLLAFHGTHHPSVPHLGFVGFYRSPYWGVMEMQARFLSRLWSPPSPTSIPILPTSLEADTTMRRDLALRTDPRASQFPMGDYMFLMHEFATALSIPLSPMSGVTPTLPHNGKPMDILTPARYVYPPLRDPQQESGASPLETLRAADVATNLNDTFETAIAALTRGHFVARAVFRSLMGEWALERTVDSRLPSHPSGTFSGTARFLLRDGTRDGRGTSVKEVGAVGASGDDGAASAEDLGLEYLYIEDGTFTATGVPGLSFRATRRYIWRYDEAGDKLSVWFVKTDDAKKADYLFHEVEFVVPEEGVPEVEGRGWEATAGHLCIADFYDTKYNFVFNAVNLKEWSVGYNVRGPKKDYTIKNVYRRPKRES